ncbi:MAG: hypothetical protein NWR47_05840, partial [Aestuariivirgaceae bacterium]|nr:hypothetical protein [Aestuariivirgaceae bacterium]
MIAGWIARLGRFALMAFLGAALGLAAAMGGMRFVAQDKIAEIVLQLTPADPDAPLTAEELAAQAKALLQDPTAAAADPINGLKITQDVQSGALTLRLQSRDGALAGGILTRLAQAYAGRAQAELPDFLLLARNTGALKNQLVEAEGRLVALKSELADLQATGAAGELKSQIAAMERKAEETRATAAAVRRAIDAGTAANSTLRPLKTAKLDELRLERDGLLADIDSMSMDVVVDDPRLLDARFELRRLDARITEQADRIAGSLEADSRSAMNRAADLRARLGALGKAEDLEKSQSELFETVANLRAALEQSLAKLAAHQASSSQARFSVRMAGPVNVSAVTTLPSLPMAAGFALLGAVAGLGFAVIKRPAQKVKVPPKARAPKPSAAAEPLAAPTSPASPAAQVVIAPPQQAARSDDWQQSFTAAARILAETQIRPSQPQADDDAATDAPGAVMASEVRRVGVWVDELIQRPGIRILGIIGIHPASADSAALAVEMARKLAGAMPRVVMVDVSTQPQMVTRLLPVSSGGGTLADFTSGRASLSDVISREDESGLHWVEGSTANAGPRLSSMLQALSAAYDVVVLHLGAYTLAAPGALMACQAVAVTAPMMDAIEARKVMD